MSIKLDTNWSSSSTGAWLPLSWWAAFCEQSGQRDGVVDQPLTLQGLGQVPQRGSQQSEDAVRLWRGRFQHTAAKVLAHHRHHLGDDARQSRPESVRSRAAIGGITALRTSRGGFPAARFEFVETDLDSGVDLGLVAEHDRVGEAVAGPEVVVEGRRIALTGERVDVADTGAVDAVAGEELFAGAEQPLFRVRGCLDGGSRHASRG